MHQSSIFGRAISQWGGGGVKGVKGGVAIGGVIVISFNIVIHYKNRLWNNLGGGSARWSNWDCGGVKGVGGPQKVWSSLQDSVVCPKASQMSQ